MKKLLLLLLSVITLSLNTSASTPCYVPTSNLTAWYSFTRNLLDSSGNDWHCQFRAVANRDTADRFGNANYAYLYNNNDTVSTCMGYIYTQNRSISFWYYNVSYGRDAGNILSLIEYGRPGRGTYFAIYVNTDGKLSIGDYAGTSIVYNATPTVREWHHVVLTYNNSNGTTFSDCKVYLDNNLLSINTSASTNTSETIATSLSFIRIGARSGYQNQYFMDDLGCWERELNSTEVSSLYNGRQRISTISGPSSLFTGTTITLSDSIRGGTWSSSNNSIATVNSSGIVTGISAGSVTITHSYTNSCGSSSATKNLTLSTSSNAPRFFTNNQPSSTYTCKNQSKIISDNIRITDIDTGQTLTWSLHSAPRHGSAIVSYTTTNTGGLIRPISATNKYTPDSNYLGNDTFVVKVTDGIFNVYRTIYITTRDIPATPTITGSNTINRRSSITLSATPSGGNWFRNTANFTVSDGIVTSITNARIGYTDYVTYQSPANSYGCRSTARHYLTVTNTSARYADTSELIVSEVSIKIFPNPTSGILNINSADNIEHTIYVSDMNGKVILTDTYTSDKQLDMNNQPAGMYIIRIDNNAYYINKI